MPATFSVVVPNYNHARYLPTALDALLAQSRQPREIVVIDDASTDGSREVIAGYAARHPVIRPIYRDQNRGVVAAMNEFLHAAENPYIYFAAADDRVLPGYFAALLGLLERHPGVAFCSALTRIIDERGHDLGVFPTPLPIHDAGPITPREAEGHLMREGSWVMGNTVIYRRAALLDEGGFRPELGGFCDGFAHLALALAHGACFVPRPLACWRRLRGSVSDQTTGNAANTLAVIDIATRLMSEHPSHRFPPRLIHRLRNRWLFGSARVLLSRPNPTLADILALFPAGHALDKTILRALLATPRLAAMYLFLRQRPFDAVTVPRRRLKHIPHPAPSRRDRARGADGDSAARAGGEMGIGRR